MEFPVIRAFQQDQTLHMGKKVDVILDLWDGCISYKDIIANQY